MQTFPFAKTHTKKFRKEEFEIHKLHDYYVFI